MDWVALATEKEYHPECGIGMMYAAAAQQQLDGTLGETLNGAETIAKARVFRASQSPANVAVVVQVESDRQPLDGQPAAVGAQPGHHRLGKERARRRSQWRRKRAETKIESGQQPANQKHPVSVEQLINKPTNQQHPDSVEQRINKPTNQQHPVIVDSELPINQQHPVNVEQPINKPINQQHPVSVEQLINKPTNQQHPDSV